MGIDCSRHFYFIKNFLLPFRGFSVEIINIDLLIGKIDPSHNAVVQSNCVGALKLLSCSILLFPAYGSRFL